MRHFHKFSSLPSELREEIWLAAIPELDDPAVVVYRAACCNVSRKVYWDELPEHLLQFDYYFDLFTKVRSLDGLLAASKESRSAALRWVSAHESMKRWRHSIVRPFDPERDILYIPLTCVICFGTQLVDLLFQPGNYEQRIGSTRTHIRRLAIPQAVFQNGDYDILTDISNFMEDLEVLYVVANHGGIDHADEGAGEQFPRSRWELHGHSCSEREAGDIEESAKAKLTVSQRSAGIFWQVLDCLEQHGRLPYEVRLTGVTKVARRGKSPEN
ncbi:hypothetical protein PWT90_02039 [Aphanocladium album]|nr:hypothetical protein PWT90_02039 [Aphanocladium album]